MSWDSPDTLFHVVVDEEEEHSIRPDHKPVPADWCAVGVSGSTEDRLARAERV
ncbi:MbtH family NRPS accessory protein [Azospirillum sp. B506]|uniref:MbtH family NRPS accessory protein n=1 Tax=Azospirillum sp. B506 TaxID=137721 RepID=UPI000344D3A7|nr:MbtH family NRPS accessory protein [Azospirillum sp. B506]